MGIENFFNTLIKTKIYDREQLEKKIKCNHLYIDFNSIVYIIFDKIEYDSNYYLYSIIIKDNINNINNNDDDEIVKKIELQYNIKLETIDEFKNYFTCDKIEEITKKEIYNFINNLCFSFENINDINNIYISFDGTPTMAKIAEQKRRKYTNYIINDIKKLLFNKYKNTIDENRIIFYENSVSTIRKNSDNSYLQDLYNNIDSYEFKNKLYSICPNLKSIIISSAYEFGEGEKKIVENIIQYKREGKYVIFSPDSDIIILSLILKNKLKRLNISNEFNIIKYKDDKNEIDNISIDLIKDNLYNLIHNKLNPYRKYNHNIENIIDDIIALFTFFGNDFIPKIESLNTRNGINIIIDIYTKHLNNSRLKNPYLLFEDKNIIKINFEVFNNIIFKLSEVEDKIIYDKYILNEYKNSNYLLNIFESNKYTPFFIDKLNRYCHGFNKIIRYIKTNINCNSINIYNNIINNFTDKESWEEEFLIIENKDNIYGNISVLELLDIIINDINNRTYYCKLKLVKYSNSIDNIYHDKNIKDKLDHPKMNITEYDKEIYKFEKQLDEYNNLFTKQDNIGITELKYKDNEYKIHTDKNIEIKKKYYYKNIIKLNTKEDKYNFIKEYIKGFFWTIDFYFNKINRQTNINNISIWNYEYNHSPYFIELSDFLNEDQYIELKKLYYDISNINSNLYTSPLQFMNNFEQYLYITPKNMLNNIPDIYKDLLNDIDIFPNIQDIGKKILNGDKSLIELHDSKYINKINIIGFKKCNFNTYMNKIYEIRKNIDYDSIL